MADDGPVWLVDRPLTITPTRRGFEVSGDNIAFAGNVGAKEVLLRMPDVKHVRYEQTKRIKGPVTVAMVDDRMTIEQNGQTATVRAELLRLTLPKGLHRLTLPGTRRP